MTEQGDLQGMPADASDLVDRGVAELPKKKWKKLLARMVDTLEDLYIRQGFEKERAGKLARDSVVEIAWSHGGKMTYLPRGDELKQAIRDAEIFSRATANNLLELAAEFKLNDSQIYRIIRQQRALHIAKVQHRFPFE